MPSSKINKLIIAGAGSGKTTYLINEALRHPDLNVLITTYTEENEKEIREKILKRAKCIPSNITIQTWFSFLIQHGIKPFQSSINEILHEQKIKGLLLVNEKSGLKYISNQGYPIYASEDEFKNHYFTSSWHIFSDKLSKMVERICKYSNSANINRVASIYQTIFIDEVQDLAGYDLEIIKFLFKSTSNIYLVGDPRQVTYLTHHEAKYKKYKDGKIEKFIVNECKKNIEYEIDTTTLSKSHRNNSIICKYSSKLYKEEYVEVEPCDCQECRNYSEPHEGIFIIRPHQIESYLKEFNPVQLRWSRNKKVNSNYRAFNFGESKGKTFDRVLIYPTDKMTKWIRNNTIAIESEARAKLYVGITRAKYSVGIVLDIGNDITISDTLNYIENDVL